MVLVIVAKWLSRRASDRVWLPIGHGASIAAWGAQKLIGATGDYIRVRASNRKKLSLERSSMPT
jgi:hypothetical protein